MCLVHIPSCASLTRLTRLALALLSRLLASVLHFLWPNAVIWLAFPLFRCSSSPMFVFKRFAFHCLRPWVHFLCCECNMCYICICVRIYPANANLFSIACRLNNCSRTNFTAPNIGSTQRFHTPIYRLIVLMMFSSSLLSVTRALRLFVSFHFSSALSFNYSDSIRLPWEIKEGERKWHTTKHRTKTARKENRYNCALCIRFAVCGVHDYHRLSSFVHFVVSHLRALAIIYSQTLSASRADYWIYKVN